MAIYHLEAKVISRGTGRSACAASAYLSCSAIYNDYDGIQHDYTRKQGLVWDQVFLPEYAHFEWQDRAALWNAVEAAEKTKDSRLAREFVVTLPTELSSDEWKSLLTDFIKDQFVADGMCADVAIHDTDGHNPHAHILLTVRPLTKGGTWQYKTEKEYLCIKDGEERGFNAAEYNTAQKDGWEKQYPYKVGKKKEYMTPSAAEARGLVRASKYPKSTKYGRQNPVSERWNSDEQLLLWREAWADTVNRALEHKGLEERIDHRSHAARGLDEQPTVHEGVIARAMEKKGLASDRCELNRQIKRDNALLRELKMQLQKILKAARSSISSIAEKLEQLRSSMLIFGYQIATAGKGIRMAKQDLAEFKPDFDRYSKVVGRIKDILKERKKLLSDKKALSPLQLSESRRISKEIAELTETYEELKSEKELLISRFFKSSDKEMSEVRKWIENREIQLARAEDAYARFDAELKAALHEYQATLHESEELGINPNDLAEARQFIRSGMEDTAVRKIQAAYDTKYDPDLMREAKSKVAKMLDEDTAEKKDPSILNRLHNRQQELNKESYTVPPRRQRRNEQEL